MISSIFISAKDSSSSEILVSSLLSLNLTSMASSIVRVLELYTLYALDDLEYPSKISKSHLESNFPRLSLVFRIKH